MVAKIVILAVCVVVALGAPQAAQFPAGVNPHACPNYPYCDNAALAAHAAGAPAPYAAPAYSAYGHQAAGVPGAAAAYPSGVDPRSCPNYPYCGPTPAHVPAPAPYSSYAAPVPSASQGGAQYPAGVNPHTCPNYPYCH